MRPNEQPARRPKPEESISVGKGGTRLSSGGMKDRHNAQIKSAQPGVGKETKGAPKPEQKPDARIEEKILAQKWAKTLQFPILYRDFMEKLVPKITLGSTTVALLNVFSNTDERADKVVRVLRSNPYYQAQFLRHLEASRGGREDAPSVESGIVLLGMENSRNLVVAMQLMRTVHSKHPDWDKNGKLELNPADTLKFALKTEEALAKRKDGFSTTAYAGGLVFDYLSQYAQRYSDDVKKAAMVLEQVYAHGMKAGKIAMILADAVPDFSLKKYVFLGCLVHDIGKAATAVLNPAYVDFWDEVRKRGLPRGVRHFAEDKRFGAPHTILGAMVCRYFSILEPLEAAVLHHHSPYTMQASNRNIHMLSSIISLASNIASQLKNPAGPQDPVFEAWLGPEIRGVSVSRELIGQAAQTILKDKD